MACLTNKQLLEYRSARDVSTEQITEMDAHLASCSICRAALTTQIQAAAPSLARRIAPGNENSFHLDEDVISRVVDGSADESENDLVAIHIENCARCAEDVRSLEAFHLEMQRFDWSTVHSGSWWDRLMDRWAAYWLLIRSLFSWSRLGKAWNNASLTTRIVGAMILGVITGLALGNTADGLTIVGAVFFKLLGALATPLIFVAIIHAVTRAGQEIGTTLRLLRIVVTNTVAAVAIGLLVVLVLRPGITSGPQIQSAPPANQVIVKPPVSLLEPLVTNNAFFVIILGIGIGFAFRAVRRDQIQAGQNAFRAVDDFLDTAFRCLLRLLQWIVALVPIGVFASVASIVGKTGLHLIGALTVFMFSVLAALVLLAVYYLVRLQFGSWVRPTAFFAGVRSALLMAFSTASSAATMPLTYDRVLRKLGLREESASLGVLAGGSINRDGTALFEVMAVLFITQALGIQLTVAQVILVMVMSAVAAVAAPGIPEAGLTTMTFILQSLGLHDYMHFIAILLTVDWLLDRCRTTVNVMGHVTVACLLDGKTPAMPLHDSEEH